MNSKKTYILLLVLLAAVIIGAAAGYKAYTSSRGNEPEKTSALETPGEDEKEETEAGETVPIEGVSAESNAEVSSEQSTAASEPEETAGASSSESEYPEAADFTVETPEGMKAKLSDLRGKPVIVNFWASWCPPCKAELPYFQDAYEEYGDRIHFMMVDLNDGSRETDVTVQNFLKETGYTFPIFYDRDGSASYTYEIYSIPVTLGIDPDGKLVYQRTGSLREQDLAELTASLLNGPE